ncbi:MAG: hypothetical protein AB7U75_09375 [Hyphomicrobiaceae bacterium]
MNKLIPALTVLAATASGDVLAETPIPHSDPGDKGSYFLIEAKKEGNIIKTLHKRVGVGCTGWTRCEINCKTGKMRDIDFDLLHCIAQENEAAAEFLGPRSHKRLRLRADIGSCEVGAGFREVARTSEDQAILVRNADNDALLAAERCHACQTRKQFLEPPPALEARDHRTLAMP